VKYIAFFYTYIYPIFKNIRQLGGRVWRRDRSTTSSYIPNISVHFTKRLFLGHNPRPGHKAKDCKIVLTIRGSHLSFSKLILYVHCLITKPAESKTSITAHTKNAYLNGARKIIISIATTNCSGGSCEIRILFIYTAT
jgi:hypothetical protein